MIDDDGDNDEGRVTLRRKKKTMRDSKKGTIGKDRKDRDAKKGKMELPQRGKMGSHNRKESRGRGAQCLAKAKTRLRIDETSLAVIRPCKTKPFLEPTLPKRKDYER